MQKTPNSFGYQIKNTTGQTQRIAIFPGTVPVVKFLVDKLVFSDPSELNKLSFGQFDHVADDGVIVPNLIGTPSDKMYTIRHFREWLKTNAVMCTKMTIKTTSQDQFDNQMLIASVSPFATYRQKNIQPTIYSDPKNLQTNKIVIEDQAFVLQDDTLFGWDINDGETVNITFQLEDVI